MPNSKPSYTGPERRRYVRVAAKFIVYYHQVEVDKNEMSFTRNIGQGGMLFTTGEAYPQDAVLRVRLKLPNHPELLDLFGKVITSQTAENASGITETRIAFLNVKPHDEDRIRKVIGAFL